jgi:hypothetical protein
MGFYVTKGHSNGSRGDPSQWFKITDGLKVVHAKGLCPTNVT